MLDYSTTSATNSTQTNPLPLTAPELRRLLMCCPNGTLYPKIMQCFSCTACLTGFQVMHHTDDIDAMIRSKEMYLVNICMHQNKAGKQQAMACYQMQKTLCRSHCCSKLYTKPHSSQSWIGETTMLHLNAQISYLVKKASSLHIHRIIAFACNEV